MQGICRFCSGQTSVTISSLNKGTPNTSVVVSIVVKSDSSSASVASTPRVRLLQCRANSLLPTALRTAAVDGFLTPLI
jgi:hypothetical protein